MPMADPAPVIGDERSALFAEINQGENITKRKHYLSRLPVDINDALPAEQYFFKSDFPIMLQAAVES